jgi:bisphosphoglycerate-independent phosphoglycerate mutase (AlkP superfamily)
VAELRDHAMNWANQVGRLKSAMASAALRPSKRRHRKATEMIAAIYARKSTDQAVWPDID